jgi:D-sedoheptulose 7-phosphate isomerase
VSLVDNVPTMTAWANDSTYENVFAEPLSNLVSPEDIALAVSGSGNSPNVLRALRLAKEAGAVTIGFGGFAGGKMKSLCDICVVVPSDNMQIIEDLHLSIAHTVFTIMVNRRAQAATAAAVSAD